MRLACVAALAAVTAFGVARAVSVPSGGGPGSAPEASICDVIETVLDIMGAPLAAPHDASAERLAAVSEGNDTIAARRDDVRRIPRVKEC